MIFEGRDLVDYHDAELAQLRLRFEREIDTGITRWDFQQTLANHIVKV